MKRLIFLAWLFGLLSNSNLLAQEALFDENGYRIAWLRSPTPESIEGAVTLNLVELTEKLNSSSPPVLIDVLPLTWMGVWVEMEPHRSLPGAVWLPNVGRAALDSLWTGYLHEHLRRLVGEDKGRELVIFCRADCWYSWNAVRRLVEQGYTGVFWYRLGTDGWLEAGRELVDIDPEPVSDQQKSNKS